MTTVAEFANKAAAELHAAEMHIREKGGTSTFADQIASVRGKLQQLAQHGEAGLDPSTGEHDPDHLAHKEPVIEKSEPDNPFKTQETDPHATPV